MTTAASAEQHPQDSVLRVKRLPHIWCPGCGLGNALRCYGEAMLASGIPLDRHVCVSGIGCSGRAAGYINVDSYHTTHGRAIPFATGLKLARPDLAVTVFSGDGDLTTIGGNHLLHAARRNMNLVVICINNFNYGMTGGQFGATTPRGARTTTTPFGNFEQPLNLPHFVAACGASFVARWTTLHVRQLRQALARAFTVDGFAFIEVISPCPVGFGHKNRLPDALDEMKFYLQNAVVDQGADLQTVGITMQPEDPLIVGNFRDEQRPSYLTARQQFLQRVLGGGP